MAVVSGNAIVSADYHQFYLDAGGDFSWDGTTTTGLIEPLALGAVGWGGMSYEDVDLAVEGPGPYVVRCSARNRAAQTDEAVELAEEEFLIETWPAPLESIAGLHVAAEATTPGAAATGAAMRDDSRRNREAELRNLGVPESRWTPDLFVEPDEREIQVLDDHEEPLRVEIVFEDDGARSAFPRPGRHGT